MRILVAEPIDFSLEAREALADLGEVFYEALPQSALGDAFMHWDVLWFRLGLQVSADALPRQPRCHTLVCPVTGLDHIDTEACTLRGIKVLSLRGERRFLRRVRATAEHTLGLALALLRHTPRAHADVLTGHWDRDRFRGRELFESTAAIVGYGRLGAIVADYFSALGMRVVAFDPRESAWEEANDHWPARGSVQRCASLEEALEKANLVSLHASYGPKTHHLIDKQALTRIRPGAVLINTARGGLVDSQALVDALQSGHLAGAALDVVEGEPGIAKSPLLAYAQHHDNLLLTPHLGGNTSESFRRTELFMVERLAERLASMHSAHSRPEQRP